MDLQPQVQIVITTPDGFRDAIYVPLAAYITATSDYLKAIDGEAAARVDAWRKREVEVTREPTEGEKEVSIVQLLDQQDALKAALAVVPEEKLAEIERKRRERKEAPPPDPKGNGDVKVDPKLDAAADFLKAGRN